MALGVLLLIKAYLGALARLHTYGIKHRPHTEDEILASAKLMANLLLTAEGSGFLSVLPENEVEGSNKNNKVPSPECTVPRCNRLCGGSKLETFTQPLVWHQKFTLFLQVLCRVKV